METKRESETEKREYVINIDVQIIHTGEKIPDKGFVINPIEEFINTRLEKFKHAYRLKRVDINIDELEEDFEDEEDEL